MSTHRVRLRNWIQPVVCGAGAFAAVVAIALTAPTTSNPPERLGLALVIGGAVISLLSFRRAGGLRGSNVSGRFPRWL